MKIGCHVSAAGGVFNAPKNAADLKSGLLGKNSKSKGIIDRY